MISLRPLSLAALALAALAGWHFRLYERIVDPQAFYYVTARGHDFWLEGAPLRFVGVNTRLVHGQKERAAVAEAFDALRARDLRVVRQWAVGETLSDSAAIHRPVGQYYFQVGPGNWQEPSFRHFDSLLVAAEERDLKVIVTLFNNWKDYGGIPMYLHWAGVDGPLSYAHHDSFYVDPRVREWAWAYAEKLVTRVNSITGVAYRDDPTIFAWEIFNESTAGFDRAGQMRAWLAAMARHIKEMDPHHLVGTSFSLYERRLAREHIKRAFALPELDYCDVHLYPQAGHQRYLFAGEEALEQVVDDLVRIARAAGKPLLIGEVGFSRHDKWKGQGREYWYDRLLAHSLRAGVSGVLPWSYSDPGWEDEFEVNWRDDEHAGVDSVLARYGRAFAAAKAPLAAGDPGWDGALRVDIPVREFARDPARPRVADGWSRYRIPVRSYARAHWINAGYWRPERGYAAVYAKDHGFFAYTLAAATGEAGGAAAGTAVLAARLKVRLATDFPSIPGADSLGRSEVRVSLNGAELGTLLVRPRRYYGTVYELAVTRGPDAPLCRMADENVLRFEVPAGARHRNGIAILGTGGQEQGAMPILLDLRLARDD